MIGRQVRTPSGPLDILCVDADGKAVVVELKRDLTPRQTVAQAIDYASWIAMQSPESIEVLANEYLKRPLDATFRERFGTELSELQITQPTILVVAARLDSATERMIEFLSDQYGVDINGLTFRFIKLPSTSSDKELLVRASVLSEDRDTPRRTDKRMNPDQLITMAQERNVLPLVARLRELANVLQEQPRKTYGGSFRYFQNGRMVCGVNVAGRWNAPHGSLDVWFVRANMGQAAGMTQESLVEQLGSQFDFVPEFNSVYQAAIRLNSEPEADSCVSLIRRWLEVGAQLPPEGDGDGA